ncbi:hypothetical protein ACG1VR_12250 [Cedecea davisae]|uniref:hypothetical protein n=1 Tax=Cedecea davisae TaxID=158484 RepID=UPI00376EE6E2
MPNAHISPPCNSHILYLSTFRPSGDNAIPIAEEPDTWFDAEDSIRVEEAWFDASDTTCNGKNSPEQNADSLVPFTEDCRRSIQQLMATLGNHEESKILSFCLSKLLPGVPANLAIAANSLYTAITERRNIDTAILQALGLASWFLPDNTIFSQSACYIRETVTGWLGEAFVHQFLGDEENQSSSTVFTALAVTALVAKHWMSDRGAAQRGLLRLPASIANLFIRLSHCWNALGLMARNNLPRGSLQQAPAFEVDSCIEVSGATSASRITAFTSNSTATPQSFIRGTVLNRPLVVPEADGSLAEQAHLLAVDKFRQQSGLSLLMNCATRSAKTHQQVNNSVITYTHLNTQCDATTHPKPLPPEIEGSIVQAYSSPAAQRSGGEALLPLVAAAAAAPLVTSYVRALKSKTVIAAGTVAGLTGLGLAGKVLWDRTGSPHQAEATTADGQSSELPPGKVKRHPPDKPPRVMNKENHSIIKMLSKKGILFLDETEKISTVSKEKMLAALASYLFNQNHNATEYKTKIKLLASKILAASYQYGGAKDEKISFAQAGSVVRRWAFNNVLGCSPEKILIDKVRSYYFKQTSTIKDAYIQLTISRLYSTGTLKDDKVPLSQRSALADMWNAFLMEEMPFLNFSHGRVANLKLSNYDLANLYTGSRFLQLNSDKAYTYQEAMSTGEKMWQLAVNEGIAEDNIIYYKFPALLFSTFSPSTEGYWASDNEFDDINRYILYRKEIMTLEQDIENKYTAYHSATLQWLNKGKLAEKIISQCPEIPHIRAIRTPGFGAQEIDCNKFPESCKETDQKAAIEFYLRGTKKPCGEAPDSLDVEYKKLTAAVADTFREIDPYLIQSAMKSLSKDDYDMISSPESFVYPADIHVRSQRPAWGSMGGGVHINDFDIRLNKTDIFAVHNNGMERIYALQGVNSDTEGYRIIRVDRNIANFINHGLFDYSFDKNFTINDRDLTFTAGSDKFKYSFSINKTAGKYNDEAALVNWLKNKHREALFNNLYQSGNDQSEFQKIWSFIKHLIPFYDCIESIVNKDPLQAIPACLTDALSFLPVFGQATRLSTKFGMQVAKGLSHAPALAGIRSWSVLGRNILHETRLPTLKELALLGANTLRAADPGFELLTFTGRAFRQSILHLLASDKKTAELANRLGQNNGSGWSQKKTPPTSTMATLPRTSLQVPVIPVGIKGGKAIYARVNPETGEAFGSKYWLNRMGGLFEIKPAYREYGGVNVGQKIPTELQSDVDIFRKYIKQLESTSCNLSSARQKRQINCQPLSLSTHSLACVLKYATIYELLHLSHIPEFRQSIARAIYDTIAHEPISAEGVLHSIVYTAMENDDTHLLSAILAGHVPEYIYNHILSYHRAFWPNSGVSQGIESPRILDFYSTTGQTTGIPDLSDKVSFTAIDMDGSERRLNILAHGCPGIASLDMIHYMNADDFYNTLYMRGILSQNFDKIRLFVCSGADSSPGKISIAERLAQLTGKPVEGFSGAVVSSVKFIFGQYEFPFYEFIARENLAGGFVGANAIINHYRHFITIGISPNNPYHSRIFNPPD